MKVDKIPEWAATLLAEQPAPLPIGFVYFALLRGQSLVKIGFTTDIPKRLAALQTASPYRVEIVAKIPGTIRDERKIHERFDSLRMRGEWFYYGTDLIEFVSSITTNGQDSHGTQAATD